MHGVAPLRLETGRYERLLPEQRTCFYCTDCIESEEHVLLSCPVYDDLRLTMESVIKSEYAEYGSLTNRDKLCIILGSYNANVIRCSAKICSDILDRRRYLIYK